MKTNTKIDKFLNSSILSTSIFITSGCYKTYKDYKNASPEYKDKFLIKDSVILSGAALGMLAYQAGANKIAKSKEYNQAISNLAEKINYVKLAHGLKTSIQYTTEILKDLSMGFISTASSILCALGADWLFSKANKDELKYKDYNEHNKISEYVDSNLAKFTDETTRSVFYSSITDIPVISSSMLGTNAINIAKDKEFKTRLKHTTRYLINDTLVPLLFLSISSALTKKLKPVYRIPTIFLSLFGGTLATRKLFDKSIS